MVQHLGNQASATIVPSNHSKVGALTTIVQLTTIDEIYKAQPEAMRAVLVMKMDIEGHEGIALRGAKEFFSEAPPCVLRVEFM